MGIPGAMSSLETRNHDRNHDLDHDQNGGRWASYVAREAVKEHDECPFQNQNRSRTAESKTQV